MKNLGIRLSNQELLNIRGGSCYACSCGDGFPTWYLGDMDSQGEANEELARQCHPFNNQDAACSLTDGTGCDGGPS